MATIDLGRLGFVNKGTYNNSTTYEKNDLVQFTDGGILSTYLYIDSSAQSGQAPSSSGTAGSRWVFFAKGVTDALGGISNNNIVVKDNSGNITGLSGNNKIITTNNSGVPTAVSIGSANEFLKVNSGATGYEFGAVSSDYVKLATQTVSGTPTTVNFDNSVVDFSTYKSHVVLFSGVSFTADNRSLGMKLSSDNGSSLISSSGSTTYSRLNGTDEGNDAGHGHHPFSVDTESDNSDGFSGEVTITSFSSGNWNYSWGRSVNQNSNGDYYRYSNGAVHTANSQPNYIRFFEYEANVTFDQGEFILYGRK